MPCFFNGAAPTENSENRLNEEGRFHQATVQKVRQVVQMPNIVALKFESCAAPLAHVFQDTLHFLERVAEDAIAGEFERLGFPVVLPLTPLL